MFNKITIDRINKIKKLDQYIQNKLIINDLEDLEVIFNQYSNLADTLSLYTLKANYYFQKNNLDSAKDIIFLGLKKFPYNFEINFNAGIVFEVLEDYIESLKYYIYSLKYSQNEEEKQLATNKCDQIAELLFNDSQQDMIDKISSIRSLLEEGNNTTYPLKRKNESLIRKVMFRNSPDEFLINMYRSQNSKVDVDNESRFQFKSELIKGKEIEGKYKVDIEGPSVIPISLMYRSTEITFRINNETVHFPTNSFKLNQYHYLRFEESGLLEISSTNKLFIGNPIRLKDKVKKTPRLVLYINIDGLSAAYLRKQNLKDIMPSTYSFFKRGFISNNCYTNGDWTLPSTGVMFTGKYTTNHGLYHPYYHYDLSERNKLMPEYFKDAGYFTAQISNNWRITPTYGYYKGSDRIVYQNFMGGFGCGEVIAEAVEHLEGFKEKNNFLWIALTDLHHIGDGIQNNLFSQIHSKVQRNNIGHEDKTTKSVSLGYDTDKIEKYKSEIKRLDVHLGTLFNYINHHYSSDEVLVVLNSDHGQTFLEKDSFYPHESRRIVPLMLYGKNVPNTISDEIINNVDVLPSLLSLSNIPVPKNIDGIIPRILGGNRINEYSFTEVLFPNQPYSVVISDDEHILRFITKYNTQNDGLVDLSEFTIRLINKKTLKEDTHSNMDKVNKWIEVIFLNIKDYIKV